MSEMRKPFMEVPASDYGLIVRALVAAGRDVEVGDMWSYAAMFEQVNVRLHGGDKRLQDALARLSRDEGIEFRNVKGEGYVRLDSQSIVERLPMDVQRIRRQAKRSMRRVANADYGELSIEEKHKADAHRAFVGVVDKLASPKGQRRLEGAMQVGVGKYDPDKIKELFK